MRIIDRNSLAKSAAHAAAVSLNAARDLTDPLIFGDVGIALIWLGSVEASPERRMDAEHGQGGAFGGGAGLHWPGVWA